MELSLDWPSVVISSSLEPLRPLSPEIFHHEHISIATDIDKLSRGERAGKLLDHFDELQQGESEPFDWFPNEKSIDIPIFESLPSPPFPDLKPSLQTYALPTTTIFINAVDYQQPQQYPPLLSSNLYDAIPSPVLYSPPPQHLQSPPPVVPVVPLAPSTPLLITTADTPSSSIYNNCDVKTECDSLVATPLKSSDAEWLKGETLTPPDSPKDEDILKMLEEIEPEALERLMMARADELDSSTPLTFAQEMSCASPGAHSDDCTSSSVRSRSISPYPTSEDGLDDPEWKPPIRIQHSSARDNNNNTNNNCSSSGNSNSNTANAKYAGGTSGSSGTSAARRRASKPYMKPAIEERRQRKKEQNKNAATRYRMKKKAEVQVVKHEEQLLAERNDELRKQLDDICREVRCLKSLMREVYRKKGLIK